MDLEMGCSGCGDKLTLDNLGGYRCFCDKCVKAMPEFPEDGRGYWIEGKCPDFKWVTDE